MTLLNRPAEWFSISYIPTWSGRPSKQHQAHHDFPWKEKKWFANHGIDVNNPAFGRWADPDTHKQWHNTNSPRFNDYWDQFILDEVDHIADTGSPYTIQEILDKLAECRAQYSIE